MKKLTCYILLISLLATVLSSCFGNEGETGTHETSYSEENISNNESFFDYNYTIEDIKPSNGIFEKYYVEIPIIFDEMQILSAYMDQGVPSEELILLYDSSDHITAIPFYGIYLEYTSIVSYLFWLNNDLIGVYNMILDASEGKVSLKDFSEESAGGPSISNDYCYNRISGCLNDFPDFELMGMLCEDAIYPMAHPLGINDSSSCIVGYSYARELIALPYIDHVSTISEGVSAYNAHWQMRADIMSNLPFFDRSDKKWDTDSEFYYLSNKYQCPQYIYDSEWEIGIPLISPEGSEEYFYALFLLFQGETLYAEIIIRENSNEMEILNEIVSQKNSSNQYIPLNSIQYLNETNKLFKSTENILDISGISYDGNKYMLVYKTP